MKWFLLSLFYGLGSWVTEGCHLLRVTEMLELGCELSRSLQSPQSDPLCKRKLRLRQSKDLVCIPGQT